VVAGQVICSPAEQIDLSTQPRANHITGPRAAQVSGENACDILVLNFVTSLKRGANETKIKAQAISQQRS